MTHRPTTDYAKNYCNRTLIVKVIVENVFFGATVYIQFNGHDHEIFEAYTVSQKKSKIIILAITHFDENAD